MSHTNRSYTAACRQLSRGISELGIRLLDDALLVWRVGLLFPTAGLFIAAAFLAGGKEMAKDAYDLF